MYSALASISSGVITYVNMQIIACFGKAAKAKKPLN
jgi:hypothetical protein